MPRTGTKRKRGRTSVAFMVGSGVSVYTKDLESSGASDGKSAEALKRENETFRAQLCIERPLSDDSLMDLGRQSDLSWQGLARMHAGRVAWLQAQLDQAPSEAPLCKVLLDALVESKMGVPAEEADVLDSGALATSVAGEDGLAEKVMAELVQDAMPPYPGIFGYRGADLPTVSPAEEQTLGVKLEGLFGGEIIGPVCFGTPP